MICFKCSTKLLLFSRYWLSFALCLKIGIGTRLELGLLWPVPYTVLYCPYFLAPFLCLGSIYYMILDLNLGWSCFLLRLALTPFTMVIKNTTIALSPLFYLVWGLDWCFVDWHLEKLNCIYCFQQPFSSSLPILTTIIVAGCITMHTKTIAIINRHGWLFPKITGN